MPRDQLICHSAFGRSAADSGAWLRAGEECEQRGDLVAAAQLYYAALEKDPACFEGFCRLGWVLKEAGKADGALECLREATRLRPRAPHVRTVMGAILKQQGRWAEAVESCRGEVELRPAEADAHYNLGLALHALGDLAAARQAYDRALQLRPAHLETLVSLGLLHQEQLQLPAAIQCFQQALACDPRNPEPHWQLATAWLAQGDFGRGWPEFEWRWQLKDFTTPPERFAQPAWDGSNPAGRRLFLHTEQGLGDAIQFVRFAGVLADQGAEIIVGCPPGLRRLFQTAPGVRQVVTNRTDLPPFDCHAALMSLPALLGTTLATLPARVPYLRSPSPAVPLPEGQVGLRKIGLVWAGNPGHRLDRTRSLALSALQPLLSQPGVRWYSLQVGPQAGEIAQNGLGHLLYDLGAAVGDLADTANWISQMDLVISVDTAVAHLAGALGRPVWTLLPYAAEWRWMVGRDDSPWYPTMRLFRQARPGDWPGLVRRLGDELASWLSPWPAPSRPVEPPAVRVRPETEHWLRQGLAQVSEGRRAAAAESFLQAVQQQPECFEARYNLGLVRHELGQFAEAIQCYRLALELKPNQAAVWNGLGAALRQTGNLAEAITCGERARGLEPHNPEVLNNLGNALRAAQRLEEAVARGQEATRLAPTNPLLWHNLGNSWRELGRTAEAIAAFDRALALRPDFAAAHWDLSFALLLGGQWERGWEEFDWRLRRPDYPRRDFVQPTWNGEELQGRRLLVHAEQGFGDTLQFVRYLPLLARQHGPVLLECQPALVPLLRSVEGVAAIVARGQPLPAFECQIPLLSVPRLFQRQGSPLPTAVPYLRALPRALTAWAGRAAGDRFKIGVVWAGNPTHQNDRQRSLPADWVRPWLDQPGTAFFSLQVGTVGPLNDPRCQEAGPRLGDFADTAALLAQMDLVISVDTAVAHLAGALGKRVWTLLPYAPDWRWLLERSDSPWYPTMRLFRQPRPGDWASVSQQVQGALTEALAGRLPGATIC